MALVGEEKTGLDGKKQFVATFDNGTLEQLEELKNFFKQGEKIDLVRLAISVLQRTKESQDPSHKQ